MTGKSCEFAVADILRSHFVPTTFKTVTAWEVDNPWPLLSECPAVRLKVPKDIKATRLSGDSTGGYMQSEWALEIHVFQYDNGDGYERFMDLVDTFGKIQSVLRSTPKLQGKADIGPPGSSVLWSGQKTDLDVDPYIIDPETMPNVLRHATIKYWIREIIDV